MPVGLRPPGISKSGGFAPVLLLLGDDLDLAAEHPIE